MNLGVSGFSVVARYKRQCSTKVASIETPKVREYDHEKFAHT